MVDAPEGSQARAAAKIAALTRLKAIGPNDATILTHEVFYRRFRNLEHLPFMIDRAPYVMCLAVDADKHLIKMPAPVRIGALMNPALPDLRSKQRTKAVPSGPHRLMADIDTALGQEILDLSQRQRVTDIHHDREADDRWGCKFLAGKSPPSWSAWFRDSLRIGSCAGGFRDPAVGPRPHPYFRACGRPWTLPGWHR